MKRALAILNGFVHDLATGLWAATVLTVWWLERAAAGGAAAPVLAGLQRQFFWVGVGCTALVFATGAGRGFTYVPDVYGPGAEAQRRRLLLAKHVVLVAVFGAGTAWQWALAFG